MGDLRFLAGPFSGRKMKKTPRQPAVEGRVQRLISKAPFEETTVLCYLPFLGTIWLVKTQKTPGEHQNRWQMDVRPP